jgi:hypothetical protein
MHSLLKHKMLQLTHKISLYMAPTCFGPFGPPSGSIRRNPAKFTVFVGLLVKIKSLKLCCAVAICASVCSVCTGCCAACELHDAQHPVWMYHLLQYPRNCILPDSVFVSRMKLTIYSDGAPKHYQPIDSYNGRVLVKVWHRVFMYYLDRRQN